MAARYNSELQDTWSIEQQQRTCREQAERNGYDVRPEFEFSDEAVSGTRRDRDGLSALMRAAGDRRFDVLYFENLSRPAREFVISMPMLKELVYVHHVRVISTGEGVDSDRSGWEIMAIFQSVQRGEYVKTLRAAVLRGHEHAILYGFSIGDWCFGYAAGPVPGSEAGRRGRNAKPRMRVVVPADPASWVRQVFTWFVAADRSVRWIAQELTRRGAPKDHRATMAAWHQSYVTRLLRNRKYVGVWPWGEKTNVRNPRTGQIRQEDRPAEDVAKFERECPELRVVDDETFFRAPALLDENEQRFVVSRRESGRLGGSTKDLQRPRHLLQGLIVCGRCGSVFKAAGSRGRYSYLECRGNETGRCPVRTRLRRDRAERLLLSFVGERVLADARRRTAVVENAAAAWAGEQARRPDEEKEVRWSLTAVGEKIGRLVDEIEQGAADLAIRDLLADRRREESDLSRRLDALRRQPERARTPPTAEFVADPLARLGDMFTAGGPKAAVALRMLLERLVVYEVPSTDRKRRFLRGRFSVGSATLTITAEILTSGPDAVGMCETFTIDFQEPPPRDAVADKVSILFDGGVRLAEIAGRLGCPQGWPRKALGYRYRENALTPPGCPVARRPTAAATGDRQADRPGQGVVGQWAVMQDIATDLGCSRDTVTKAVQYWFTVRGLEPLDGRSRLRSLRRLAGAAVDRPSAADERDAA